MLHIFLRFPSSTWCVFTTQTITGIKDRRFIETSKISSLRAGAVWYGLSMKHQTCHSKPNASGWIEIPVADSNYMEDHGRHFQHFLFCLFLVCEAQWLYLQWRSHDLPVPNNFSYKSWQSWPVSFPPSLPFTLSPQRPVFNMPVLDDSSHLEPGSLRVPPG